MNIPLYTPSILTLKSLTSLTVQKHIIQQDNNISHMNVTFSPSPIYEVISTSLYVNTPQHQMNVKIQRELQLAMPGKPKQVVQAVSSTNLS